MTSIEFDEASLVYGNEETDQNEQLSESAEFGATMPNDLSFICAYNLSIIIVITIRWRRRFTTIDNLDFYAP